MSECPVTELAILWNNIQAVRESGGIYIYKFTKHGRPVWVAWNDTTEPKTVWITLDSNAQRVTIIEAVPRYESGKEVTDYSRAFKAVSEQYAEKFSDAGSV